MPNKEAQHFTLHPGPHVGRRPHVSVDRQRQLGGDRGRSYERCDLRNHDRFEDPGERIRVRVDVTPD